MEKKNSNRIEDFTQIKDEQEKIHLYFNTIGKSYDNKIQSIQKRINIFKILKFTLIIFISGEIIAFFIHIILRVHFLIFFIDLGSLILFIFCLIHLMQKYKKFNQLIKISELKKKKIKLIDLGLKKSQIIIYLSLISLATFIFVFSLIEINPFAFLIILIISLIFVYFNSDDNTEDS